MSKGFEKTISEEAIIGDGTIIGAYCVIEKNVQIGKNCVIGHHVVVHAGTRLGDGVRIDDFACIGKQPFKAARSATTTTEAQCAAQIADACIIGTGAIVYAGVKLEKQVLVADNASVREKVKIGVQTIIGRGVTVENSVTIGRRCKVEAGAYLTAHSVLKNDCFIAPGVVTSNDAFAGRTKARFQAFKGITVENGGRIGAGAVLLPGRTVEMDGFAAAGSVVTHDITEKTIVAGNPAKPLRSVPEEQLLENQE
ncbi:MAG TPA: UDP-3-O-(3-hydroxymyristoyl)glucosamine N-acyltransferase [Ruminococcaceae bacterium]|nr:UDP-3-O-(3-hydroxymyristoyl)glucosamine N-acyltransferase [Oscillospiraceae bacterium]